MGVLPQERALIGREALECVTSLLQRCRLAQPTAGLFEAADVQWWWRTPRATDAVPQLFWFDDGGHPCAAAVLTDWGRSVSLVPVVVPGSQVSLEQVVQRGIERAAEHGFPELEIEAARDDAERVSVLTGLGFEVVDDGVVEAWLDVRHRRPPVSDLAAGNQLTDRAASPDGHHHLVTRNGVDVEERLRQTSLYRADLDLAVTDSSGAVAAYGLMWFDPVTATGLVEPMRTEDVHQGRGLARHVLTAGVERLALLGAERVKICFEPGNAAAKAVYLGAGFVPHHQTDVWARRA